MRVSLLPSGVGRSRKNEHLANPGSPGKYCVHMSHHGIGYLWTVSELKVCPKGEEKCMSRLKTTGVVIDQNLLRCWDGKNEVLEVQDGDGKWKTTVLWLKTLIKVRGWSSRPPWVALYEIKRKKIKRQPTSPSVHGK